MSDVLDTALESLGSFLPRLVGAIVLLVVGVLVARVVAAIARRALQRAGADHLAERVGVADVLERTGLGRSGARVVGLAVRVGLIIVTVFAALSLLGLEFLSESLNAAVVFLPNLLAALALVLAGVVLGGLARGPIERATAQMDLPFPLGRVAQVAIVGVFAITAAAQIAISTAILFGLLAILVAGAAATFALAFGLGGRDVALSLTARRYLDGALDPGATITVRKTTGTIVAVEPTVTVLRTDSGDKVRIPNRLLLDSVVRVHEAGE